MLLVPILLLSFTAVADSASGRTSCTPGCRVLPLVAASVDGSGDSTLVAGMRAIQDVTLEPADDYFVFLVSDANLEGYGVSPSDLTNALTSEPAVKAFMVFIAEQDVAAKYKDAMPHGRAEVVINTADLPLVFRNMFGQVVANNPAGVGRSRM